jgi:mRNA-degrading endonuclease toxin of MazEF toxin-antitoxin module
VYRARIISVTSGNQQVTVTAVAPLTTGADVATLHIN